MFINMQNPHSYAEVAASKAHTVLLFCLTSEGLCNSITTPFLLTFINVDKITQNSRKYARGRRKNMERRNRKEKEKKIKGNSITKHSFPIWKHNNTSGKVNAETRSKRKTLCGLLSEMGLSTGHRVKLCLASGCS